LRCDVSGTAMHDDDVAFVSGDEGLLGNGIQTDDNEDH
jgi:hypothetical protein